MTEQHDTQGWTVEPRSLRQHTPGPWGYDHHGFICEAKTDASLAQTWDKRENDFPNASANGRLMAAAPLFLEACIGDAIDESELTALDWLSGMLTEYSDRANELFNEGELEDPDATADCINAVRALLNGLRAAVVATLPEREG